MDTELAKLARKAGLTEWFPGWHGSSEELEKFAEYVLASKLKQSPATSKPLSTDDIDQLRKNVSSDEYDSPEAWSFLQGFRTAERFHKIGK